MSHRFRKVKTCQRGFAVLLSVCWIWIGDAACGQENWTRFRGPNGTGLAEKAELPAEISDENYRWKIELAGIGSSSPVIWGDKIFITSCDPDTATLTLQCLDTVTGQKNWSRTFQSLLYRVHRTAKHIYVTDEAGNLYVIAVSDEYNRVACHPLGESTRSTPAISDNRLYLRTDSHLICVGNKKN